LVQVHQSGKVSLTVHGFSDSFGPVADLKLYDVPTLQPAGAAQATPKKKKL
jgi:hypothetical protein